MALYGFLNLKPSYAARAVPHLEKFLRHKHHKSDVVYILKRIGTPEALEILKKHGIQ